MFRLIICTEVIRKNVRPFRFERKERGSVHRRLLDEFLCGKILGFGVLEIVNKNNYFGIN